MLNIYISSLGKYNEGELVGKWLTLPCSEEELNNLFVEIGVGKMVDGEYVHGLEVDGVFYEETAIYDFETDIQKLEIGEYDSISELNQLAMALESLCEYDRKKAEALIEWNAYSNYAEAIDNLDNYSLNEDVNSESDLGYYYLFESGCYTIPDFLTNYVDTQAFGRDISINGNGFSLNMGG